MTQPQGVPLSPNIEALRHAAAAYADCKPEDSYTYGRVLHGAAQEVLREYDQQVAYIQHAMAAPPITAAQMEAAIERGPGQAKGTLDP